MVKLYNMRIGKAEREQKRELSFFSLCESVLNYTLACRYRELSPQIGVNSLNSNGFCRTMQM